MDTLSSTEFRKHFARLSEPTTVTVNGHPIGTWDPRVVAHAGKPLNATETVFDDDQGGRIRRREPAFAQFRPAPKPGKR